MSRAHSVAGAALTLVATACTYPVKGAPAPAKDTTLVAPPVVVVAQPQSPTPTISMTPPPPTIDRSRPPQLTSPKAVHLPPITDRRLPNGLRLVVVEHHELPVSDFSLVIRNGAETDPKGKEGLATLSADLFTEGTPTRTSLQIADQESFLGVDINSSATWDQTRVSLHTPTAQLDSALALFADVALHPAFPASELERLRKERLTDLLQQRDQPSAIADRAYTRIVYGESYPYGHALTGTEASARAITRSDVKRWYDTYVRPNNATLLVVGDVQPADIERRITALFGGWTAAPVPAVTPGAPAPASRTTIYLIDKPGAAQSSFRIAQMGVARSTADYYPLRVLNTVLGGTFTSRLNQNLRERLGYTYGASSNFIMRRFPGTFTAASEIVTAKSDSALIEFMRLLRSISDTVPTEELVKAKRFIELRLPGDFETTAGIAGQLVPLVNYGLPLDFYDAYVDRVEAVTQADVQRVARKYLDPEHLAIVIVGDRKTIERGLAATHIADVQLRDITGKPVSTVRTP